MHDLPLLVFGSWIQISRYVCNGCHDLKILCLNISDIATITVKNVDCHCILHDHNKSQAITLLENYVLEDCRHI